MPNPYSFLQNKPAVIATFTVAGIVGLVLLVILATTVLRRRRRRQMDIDAIEASMSDYTPPVDDDDPFHGIGNRNNGNANRMVPYSDHDDDTQKGYGVGLGLQSPPVGERTSLYNNLGGFDTPQGRGPSPTPTPMMAQVAGYNMQNVAPGEAMMLSHSNTTASQYSQPSVTSASTYSNVYPHGQYPQYQQQQLDTYHETPSAANSTVGLLDAAGLAGSGNGNGSVDGHGHTGVVAGYGNGNGNGQTVQESYASYYALKPKHSVSPSVATSGSATVVSHEGRHEEKGGRASPGSIDEDAPRLQLKVANE
ncbi:hypothetical protein D9758_012274 [Tetrapyrgos nigripes]|uniref:Uncharacterized protein n=1 Tax=Tetrapyrgos nigripes TaxID=182062 RepID=A0A8H5CGN6_9AGAR|nr:hypothetical protein D9758_012274 [Tetrapyrgos nigripes]